LSNNAVPCVTILLDDGLNLRLLATVSRVGLSYYGMGAGHYL